MARYAASGDTQEPRPLGLALRIREGALAWQGTVEVSGVGLHTLIVAAGCGDLLFRKFDQYYSGPAGSE
jgi:hypothetical protein